MLENYGINCEIRNERLSSVVGHYQPFSTWIELWIKDDAMEDESIQNIEKFSQMKKKQPENPGNARNAGRKARASSPTAGNVGKDGFE